MGHPIRGRANRTPRNGTPDMTAVMAAAAPACLLAAAMIAWKQTRR